jgi:hypothetical protein
VKQSPELTAVRERMRPGALSKDGFLGEDTRSLGEIIEADEQSLRRLGISRRAIARRMRHFWREGKKGLGDPIEVDGRYEVEVHSYKGRMACPFEHPGLFEKTIVMVRNLERDQELRFTTLALHLIESHGFFQGRGAAWRLEPGRIVELLEVEADEDEPGVQP